MIARAREDAREERAVMSQEFFFSRAEMKSQKTKSELQINVGDFFFVSIVIEKEFFFS